jgi:hypothetical protein
VGCAAALGHAGCTGSKERSADCFAHGMDDERSSGFSTVLRAGRQHKGWSARDSTSAATVSAAAVAFTGATCSVSTSSPTTAASAPAATARSMAPATQALRACAGFQGLCGRSSARAVIYRRGRSQLSKDRRSPTCAGHDLDNIVLLDALPAGKAMQASCLLLLL